MVSDTAANYLDKADEALAGAERELALNAANNAANRAYYAAFLAAVAALWREGIRPRARRGQTLSHRQVRSEWSGRLIYRRKRYPASLRRVLEDLWDWRVQADYDDTSVTRRQAERAVRLSRRLVTAVQDRLRPGVPSDAGGGE